ncbi:MAG: tail fiber protein [Xanthobacteraceae bacterium]|jgi:microcystin-dependent protein
MSQAYLGEIRCFGFNFAPYNWALCSGQLLPISQYTALFSILGTNFGGNGTTTFGLPNLQGQIPMHWGSGPAVPTTVIGEAQGAAQVTLLSAQLPQHIHAISSATPGSSGERSAIPTSTSYLSEARGTFVYQNPPVTPNSAFSPKAISQTGSNQPHDNMQPYLVLNFCIALYGIFPSRS